MLHIQCNHCGQTLKGKEVAVTPFYEYFNGIKYQNYAVVCSKCDGVIVWDRYAEKAAANKAKAMAKAVKKTQKSVKQITEEEQYAIIMRKVGKRAKDIATARNVSPPKVEDFYKAVDELPKNEKAFVLAYEEKQDMELLKVVNNKPTKHIAPNSILLLTQAIIESAIADKDEDFFQSKYGEQVVDTYNTMLTVRKGHDYGITADLLLEKMLKKSIQVQGEE